jgi:hypothetical protein
MNAAVGNVSEERLNAMTKEELVTYANMTFGLNVNAKMNKSDLIGAIMRSEQRFGGNADLLVGDSELPPGYAKLKINTTELNKAGRPVIVGLNGKMFSLPVGIEFGCPMPLVEILNNAVQYQYEQDPASLEMVRREVHSYPFTVLETAPLNK